MSREQIDRRRPRLLIGEQLPLEVIEAVGIVVAGDGAGAIGERDRSSDRPAGECCRR